MLTFTGSDNQRVQFLVGGFPTIQAAKSISYWFYYTSTPGGNQNHFAFNNGAGASVQCGTRGTTIGPWGWGGAFYVSTAAPAINQWHWFGYTYDGTYHTLYLDGAQVAQATTATQSGTTTLAYAGYGADAFPESYTGNLDDIRMYNASLSANAILSIYAMQGGDPLYANLMSRYLFIEGAPGTVAVATSGAIRDLGPNANHGTANGTTGRPVYGESVLKKHRRVLAHTAG